MNIALELKGDRPDFFRSGVQLSYPIESEKFETFRHEIITTTNFLIWTREKFTDEWKQT